MKLMLDYQSTIKSIPAWLEIEDAQSAVAKFRYWKDAEVVQVRYHYSSAIYNYFPVSREMYDVILQAENKSAIIEAALRTNRELQKWKYYYQ
jgi:hypothetical protein